MSDPQLVVSIDRSSLSLTPFVMSGKASDATAVALIGYTEPAMQPRLALAPESEVMHGDVALGWTWQQVILSFQVATVKAASESASRAASAELIAAVTQFSFPLTITINDADPETWTCSPGSLTPDGERTLANMRLFNQVWSLSIPAYPIRST